MFNPPGHGQWVQFSLPEAAAKTAEEAGAYKTRQNLFCGIVQTASRTVEGVIVLPPRIVLVGEDGSNVKILVKPIWRVVEPWALLPPVETQVFNLFKDDGCIGVAESITLIDYKEDIPKARRPDIHPKDMRKPLLSPWEIAQRRLVEQQGNKSQGVELESQSTSEESEQPQVEETPKQPDNTGRRMGRK